jgi:predicted Zn-dependent protease
MKCVVYVLLFLMAFSYCEAQLKEESVVAAVDVVTEVRLGRFWRDLRLRQPGVHVSTNASYQELIERIGNRILRAVEERPDLDEWSFTVIEDSFPNAFAYAGGQILVTTGMIEITRKDGVPDEEMIAGVLGHEIAHANLHHGIRKLQTAGSLEWIVKILDQLEKEKPSNKGEPEAKKMAGKAEMEKLFELSIARFTRIQEFEADAYGAFYAAVAGYHYSGSIRYCQLMIDKGFDYEVHDYWIPKNTTSGPRVKDHPTELERIEHMKAFSANLMNIASEFDWGYEMLLARNYDKAIRCFKDVTLKYPLSYQAWTNLGKAYHMKYLEQQDPKVEKFQVDLADYFVNLRELLRDPKPLQNALDCYRKAHSIVPNEPNVKNNLAVALAHTGETSDLEEAEDILSRLLKRDPSNARFANHMAIVLYKNGQIAQAETLFSQAAKSLPAASYNLAVVQLESGKPKEAFSSFTRYLQTDNRSGWADFARQTLQQHNQNIPEIPKSPEIKGLFGILPGVRRDVVIAALGSPDRTEKVSNSAGDNGERYWYPSLGVDVVLLEGRVQSINLTEIEAPALAHVPDTKSVERPQPEFLGIEIGHTETQLKGKLGTLLLPGDTSRRIGKTYSYTDGKLKVDFLVYLSKVMGISLQSL